MTDIKLEIQSGKLGSKTKLTKKDVIQNKPSVPILSPPEPIDYAERLFKLEQLRYRQNNLQEKLFRQEAEMPGATLEEIADALLPMEVEVFEINTQISKLLEDE